MIRALVVVLLLLPSLALAQGVPMHQSGTVTPGHLLKSAGPGLSMDVGSTTGDANGRGVSPFSISDALGLGLCSNTAATGGQHYSFCLGHDSSGNALLQVTANGGALEKSCILRINGVDYGCVGGGGNVNGPVSSTSNEPALWNGTAGNTLKNANAVVIAHTGGLTTTDTTTPTSYTAEPSFSQTWKTANLIQLTNSATHIGENHMPLAVVSNSTGSGANGPGNDDTAASFTCNQTNYLTTAVLGQQSCLWAYLTHGAQGDAGLYLASIRRVDDPAVPNYGSILYEGAMAHVAKTTGTTVRAVHPTIGYGITGFQNVTAVAAGAGGTCRLTIENTGNLSVGNGVTVMGIQGAPECNGNWSATVVDGTHLDLTSSVLIGTYTAGGAVGTPLNNLGGPNFGFEARAETGQNGIGFLVSRALPPLTGTWGSAFRVRYQDDNKVAFDMSANSGRFVVQAPTRGSMLDENYSATFLNGPIRWAGSTAAVPRDNPQFPGTDFPGGGALGFNYCSGTPGCGASELWNLLTTATESFAVYQKTSASAYTKAFSVTTGGISSPGALIGYSGTAIPAGGTAGAGLKLSSTANFGVFFGSGAPTLTAAKGSLYLRSNGTTTNDRAYINTDGGTTWTPLTTGS